MDEEQDRFHVGHRVRTLDNMLKRNMQLVFNCLGVDEVTAASGFIIMYLYHHPDQETYQKDIEREFRICRSAVTNILNRMEENGLIYRETDDSDLRMKKLALTVKGEEQSRIIHSTIDWLNRKQLEGIPAGELKRFFRTLDRIEENAVMLSGYIQGEDVSWMQEIRGK